MKPFLLGLIIFINATIAFAVPSWEQLANGDHSFKALGPDFYVEVPVRQIEKSRIKLSFVNRRLVERLGLPLSSDLAKVEKELTDLFGWEVDPTKSSPKKWMATHYMDSSGKGPEDAKGDGRALWTGELKLKTADGKFLYVDGVQKGVGATPFAWLGNPGHNDGKQNTGELIRSGVKSIADIGNQLDSTGDLIGFTITGENGEKTSMTLRVGRQTRPAHIAWHADNPMNEKKMMDYIVRRDLGLDLNVPVTVSLFQQWQASFAKNNAEDTARAYALNAFFEQPTKGNKTTTGGAIDLNGRQYMDAYHTDIRHLYRRLDVGSQLNYQKSYIHLINDFLKQASYYPYMASPGITEQMNTLFIETYINKAAQLQLHRLGLSQSEIESLSTKSRYKFFKATDNLMRAIGKNKVKFWIDPEPVHPAAYDVRKILKGTMRALERPIPADRNVAMNELYKVDYAWASPVEGDEAKLKAEYSEAVMSVIQELGGKLKPEWAREAQYRSSQARTDMTKDSLWDKWANPIRMMAESGRNWLEISNMMDRAADSLIDPDLPIRDAGMLKPANFQLQMSCQKVHKKAG